MAQHITTHVMLFTICALRTSPRKFGFPQECPALAGAQRVGTHHTAVREEITSVFSGPREWRTGSLRYPD